MAMYLADLFAAGQEGRQAARDDQTRKGLAAFLQGDQSAIGQVYQNAPEVAFKAEGLVDERRAAAEDRLGKLSTAFAQSKDPTVYAQWRQVAQGVLGPQAANMPESLDDPADLDGAIKTATALAQAYGQGVKQPEAYTLAPGAKRYDGNNQLVAEAPFAPQGFKGTWDSARAMWIPQPGTEGSYGGPTTNPITGTDFGIGETNDYVRKILSKAGNIDPNATPEQQAEALLPYLIQQESGGDPNAVSPKGAQGLTQVMPSTGRDPGFGVSPLRDGSPQENVRFGRDYLTAMLKRYRGRPDLALAAYNAGPGVADRFAGPQASRGGLAGIPVAGVSPKTDQADVPKGYRATPDGNLEIIPGGPADIAKQARDAAIAAKADAAAAKDLAKRQEATARQVEAATTANDLVTAIDTLTSHKGFNELGTASGDLKLGTPLIRSAVKDADAQLKNIGGQVAMATMSRLKALSANGSTGFGALSEKELGLLQNAIATLQSDQISNAQIKASLKVIRDKMEQIATWKVPEDAPRGDAIDVSNEDDALIGKYL